MAAHSSFVSNNHPACSIRSPCPFCVHARSLSRYARSCFARQLLRSLHSHSPAILWQMLRYVRQVFVGSSQIIKPLPCHLPHSLSNCQFPMPLNKKCATPAGGSRRQAPSCFGLPPSTTLAPLASARASSLRKEKTRRFAPQFFLCSVPAQGCITCSQQFYHFLKLFYQIQIGAQETLKQSWVSQPDPILSHSFPVAHSILPNAVHSTLLNVVQFTLPNTVQSTLPDAILHT